MDIKEISFHTYIHPIGLSTTDTDYKITIDGEVVTLKSDKDHIITPWNNVKSAKVKEVKDVKDDKPKATQQKRSTTRTKKTKTKAKTVVSEKL